MKKIKWFLLLLKEMIFRKKAYNLSFTKENGVWYYDFPNWPLKKENLMMVGGASKLLDHISKNTDKVSIQVFTKKPANYNLCLNKFYSTVVGGGYYNILNMFTDLTVWICPVTLTVLGKYPNNIYIKFK